MKKKENKTMNTRDGIDVKIMKLARHLSKKPTHEIESYLISILRLAYLTPLTMGQNNEGIYIERPNFKKDWEDYNMLTEIKKENKQ